jgi:hypothetical protein
MYKLRAELKRQGLQPTEAELGQEAAYGAESDFVVWWRHIYGMMPREFYNPA